MERRLELLLELNRIASSPLNLKEKVRQGMDSIAEKMGTSSITLYFCHKEGEPFTLAYNKGQIPHFDQGILERGARKRGTLISPGPGGEIIMATPLLDEERCLGVMLLEFSQEKWPGEEDQGVLTIAASLFSGMVKGAWLQEETRRKVTELAFLSEVGKALSSTLELDELLELVVRVSTTVIPARGAILRLLDPAKEELPIVASFGLKEEGAPLRLGEGIAGMVAQEGLPLIIPDVVKGGCYASGGHTSLICVPLRVKGKVIGTLGLYDKVVPGDIEEGTFTQDDLNLLSTLASQAAIAIENSRLFREMDRLSREHMARCQELSILHQISSAMASTMKLDRLLHIILTGVTFGGGLGFNRALLLLVNEKARVLQGIMGVGPSSGEEAATIWEGLDRAGKTLSEVISDEGFGRREGSPIDRLAKDMRVPLVPEAGVLALTALERKPILIRDTREDPRVKPEFEGRLQVKSFATTPLIAKDRVVGVLVVDNKFNQREITREDLEFLSLFANQAGMAIENALIHAHLAEANRELQNTHHQLIQREKFAVLGEMAANIVHEIRNPLVSIGGFARRLERSLSMEHLGRRYAEIVINEVDRLEKIVAGVLSLSRDLRSSPTEVDLNEVIEDCLILFEDLCERQRVSRHIELSSEIPRVKADVAQMKQITLNLLYNALEAMPEGGELLVRTTTGPGEVTLEVKDSGGGIPVEVLDQIFDPFFTTKEQGTGLGLTLVNKIVKSYGGRIEVQNRPGHGASFLVRLPRA